jgi:hypothetical protein
MLSIFCAFTALQANNKIKDKNSFNCFIFYKDGKKYASVANRAKF